MEIFHSIFKKNMTSFFGKSFPPVKMWRIVVVIDVKTADGKTPP